MKIINLRTVSVAMLILLSSSQASALATLLGDPENGKTLENARCTACHVKMFGGDGNGIYTRPERVKTVEGLMLRVQTCNVNTQNGELNSDQIDDITAHLNETFYLYDD